MLKADSGTFISVSLDSSAGVTVFVTGGEEQLVTEMANIATKTEQPC